MPYRRTAARWPIEDGDYDDFKLLVQAACRASVRLGEPVLSWDQPKSFRIGFMVGRFLWTISPRKAARTCPPELQGYLRNSVTRQRLALLMTLRPSNPAPSRQDRLMGR